MYKAGRKPESSFSHSFLAVFPSLVMQQISSFLKQVCFSFFKCLCIAGFLQLGALYANTRHDPRSEYNWWKKERSECQWSWGGWECSENPAGVLGGETPE